MKTTLRATFVDYRQQDGGVPSVTLQLEGGDSLTLKGEPWMLIAMRQGHLARVTIEVAPDDDDNGGGDEWEAAATLREIRRGG